MTVPPNEPAITPPIVRPPRDGVEPSVLFEALESAYNFVVSTDIDTDALSYELPDHSLKHHCYLLSPTRPGESFEDEWRIMGRLWYGKRYHHGFVIEIFGKSIVDHMTEIAHRIQSDFDGEVQVMTRTLKTPRYK